MIPASGHRAGGSARTPGARAASLLTAVVLSAAACGIPTASTPTPIAKSDVPYHLLTPPPPTTTLPGTPPAVGVAGQIFRVAPDGHLVAAAREVAVPASPTQVMGALLAGPTATESATGIQSFLSPTGVQVTLSAADGTATVNFSSTPIQVVGPDQTLALSLIHI